MDRITAAKVFITIVELGSLTGAADSLDMSRSMVTRYLASMEEWAGVRLLHRSTRRLSLTPAGEQVLAQCEKLVDLANEVADTAEMDDQLLKGKLRVSCSLSLAQDVLLPIFDAFLEEHSGVEIDLRISNQPVNLIEERIDLAIRISNDLDPSLVARRLGNCESVICAAPTYLNGRKPPVTIEDLAKHNCLVYSRFDKGQWNFTSNEGPISVPVTGNLTANDPTLILSASLQGFGLSMQPAYSVRNYLENGQLVEVLPDYKPETLGIFGVYSSRIHMPKAQRAMIDLLVKHLKQYLE